MSLLEDVRAELASAQPDCPECPRWEARGVLEVWGQTGSPRARLHTDSGVVARRFYRLFRDLGARRVLVARRPKGGFVVAVYAPPTSGSEPPPGPDGVSGGPDSGGAATGRTDGAPPLPRRRCCRKSYVRGCFLARGFLNSTSHGYHWEIKTPGRGPADRLGRVLRALGLPNPRVGRWQKGWVAYLKDVEQISQWLGLVGAHESLLELESARVERDMRARVNRQVNYETANLTRTVEAALRQKEDIRLIERTVGLANLPPGLRALAEARLAQPLASLAELGQSLEPPLSKSGASHRMRVLHAWAERIRREQERRGARSPNSEHGP
ncbi:MAG: DNA-binding protein WhiA [Firmicutes bacterium]|nr:DNA-binding protein WhiA [Bacillota bacterium]